MRSAPRRPWLLAVGFAGLAGLYAWWRWSVAVTQTEGGPATAPETRNKAPLMPLALSFAVLVAAVALWFAYQAYADHVENLAVARAITGGNPDNAEPALDRYGCGGCHTIPGVPGATGQVGPQLAGLRQRVYIGGVLRNTPRNLIAWIVTPERFSPNTAMPTTGISAAEARDVAAYLYAH